MKYIYIFIVALGLNIIWENAHSVLYIHYQGGLITEFILLRAAFFDAAIITLVAYIFFSVLKIKYGLLSVIITLIVFAIGLETWALETGRWAYKAAMPIIPFIYTGLTPTIQLGLLGYFSILIQRNVVHR